MKGRLAILKLIELPIRLECDGGDGEGKRNEDIHMLKLPHKHEEEQDPSSATLIKAESLLAIISHVTQALTRTLGEYLSFLRRAADTLSPSGTPFGAAVPHLAPRPSFSYTRPLDPSPHPRPSPHGMKGADKGRNSSRKSCTRADTFIYAAISSWPILKDL